MKIGSLIRANNSGLGTLAREFFDHGLIHKGIFIPNEVYKDFPERFLNFREKITEENIICLLKDIDVLLCFENIYKWEILKRAKEKGIKTILIVMLLYTLAIPTSIQVKGLR